jgi:toxin ParE1/3/4
MLRLRISGPARADLRHILATSLVRWGEPGRARYTTLLQAALRAIVRSPTAPTTRDRSDLAPGVRSYHLRLARRGHGVADPRHVIFYRKSATSIEIVRVLHERMEPTTHVAPTRRRRQR